MLIREVGNASICVTVAASCRGVGEFILGVKSFKFFSSLEANIKRPHMRKDSLAVIRKFAFFFLRRKTEIMNPCCVLPCCGGRYVGIPKYFHLLELEHMHV